MELPVMSSTEIKLWLQGFLHHNTRMQAFLQIPNDCYAHLRNIGYLDVEHDVTPKGLAFLQETTA